MVEYTVLDALSRRDGWHMRMQQLARATALSSSATTRTVNRTEDRGLLTRILCADDRRGIYTELTVAGQKLLEAAKPVHDETTASATEAAEQVPELEPRCAHWERCRRPRQAQNPVLFAELAVQRRVQRTRAHFVADSPEPGPLAR